MPLPYSADLRERVLLAYEHGEGTAAELARRFRLALNTVKNWVRAAEREGRRVAKPLGHGPEPRLGAAEREVLCQLVATDNHATLAEYGARLAGQTGVRVSRPVLCVTLKRLGLARKKDAPGERAGTRRCRRRTRRLCRRDQDRRARGPCLSRRDRGQHQADPALCARAARPARLWHRTRPLASPHRARRAGAERPGLRHDRARCHRRAGVSDVSARGRDPRPAPAQAGRHSHYGPPRRPSSPPDARTLGPSTGSGVPASRCCPCRATPPTCRRSNPAGPSSRRCCAPPSRARSRPSKSRSLLPSIPSPPKMPRAGSAIAGMLCQAKPKTALAFESSRTASSPMS